MAITASTYGDMNGLGTKDMQNYPASFGGAKLKYEQHKQLLGENYPVTEDVKLMDEWLNLMYLQNTGVSHITKSLISGAHKGADMMVRGRLIDTICDLSDRSETAARNDTANMIRAFKVMLSDFQKLQASGILNEARAKGIDISQNSEMLATTNEGMRMIASMMTTVEDFMMVSENIKTMMLHAGQTIQRTSDILSNMQDVRYEDNIRNIYMINRPGVVSQDMIPDALKNMIPNNNQPVQQYNQYGQPMMPQQPIYNQPAQQYNQYGQPMMPQQPIYNQPAPQYGPNNMYIPMGADGKPYTYGNHPINMGPSINPAATSNISSQQLQNNPNLMVATQPLNGGAGNAGSPKSMIDPAAQAVIDAFIKGQANQQPAPQYGQPMMSQQPAQQYNQYGQPMMPAQPASQYGQPMMSQQPAQQYNQYGQPMMPAQPAPQYGQPTATNYYTPITPQQPYSDILGFRAPAQPQQPSMASLLFN